MKTLTQLAALFRFLQLYAHATHNTAKGPTFFADHEFLGELYPTYEAAYDALVERIIGLTGAANIQEITAAAAALFAGADVSAIWATLLEGERKVCELVELAAISDELSQGTINLLVGLADQSEARAYKLAQRAAN